MGELSQLAYKNMIKCFDLFASEYKGELLRFNIIIKI